MLHVEVVLVVENGDRLVVVLDIGRILLASGVDGDGGEVDLLVHLGGVSYSGGHFVGFLSAGSWWKMKGFADERSRGRDNRVEAKEVEAGDSEVGREAVKMKVQFQSNSFLSWRVCLQLCTRQESRIAAEREGVIVEFDVVGRCEMRLLEFGLCREAQAKILGC